jgi:hypothetical protein
MHLFNRFLLLATGCLWVEERELVHLSLRRFFGAASFGILAAGVAFG